MARCATAALLSVACAATGWLPSGIVQAQPSAAWPDKPIRVLVGFPPGTSTDTLTRMVATRMAESLGQPIAVENKPGAGSSIAAEMVARAAPDGYTLLATSSANTINPSLYRLSFDLLHDLVPVGGIAEAPLLIIGWPGTGLRDVAQVIAAARARPDSLAYGSSGVGTFVHLNAELFKMSTGTRITHVPYKGSSQAIADLLSGQIQLLFTPASTAIPHVKAGKAVALGLIGRRRSAELPEVPTLAEAGVSGLDSALWSGLHAPAGTSPAVIDRLNRELQRALALPDVRAQIATQSNEPLPGTPAQFGAMVREDVERWARVVKSAGIKAD
jgi:tripartite-type tricarboxylate transporter receptor subunit TctC